LDVSVGFSEGWEEGRYERSVPLLLERRRQEWSGGGTSGKRKEAVRIGRVEELGQAGAECAGSGERGAGIGKSGDGRGNRGWAIGEKGKGRGKCREGGERVRSGRPGSRHEHTDRVTCKVADRTSEGPWRAERRRQGEWERDERGVRKERGDDESAKEWRASKGRDDGARQRQGVGFPPVFGTGEASKREARPGGIGV
jgi:hypothetical protein